MAAAKAETKLVKVTVAAGERVIHDGEVLVAGEHFEIEPQHAKKLVAQGSVVEGDAPVEEAPNYGAKTADELQAEADARSLTVEGTGKDGRVTKADLVDALTADDDAAE